MRLHLVVSLHRRRVMDIYQVILIRIFHGQVPISSTLEIYPAEQGSSARQWRSQVYFSLGLRVYEGVAE